MRYLAILKDSLREARDSWVMLGLFVLTTLVILFVASISFQPQSAHKTMEMFFTPMMSITLNNRKPEKANMQDMAWAAFKLDDVKLIEGDEDSPLSEYALTVTATNRHGMHEAVFVPPVDGPAGGPKKPKIDDNANIKKLRKLFDDAASLDYLEIEDIQHAPNAPDEPRYVLKIKGTSKTHRLWATQPSIFFGAFTLDFLVLPLSLLLYGLASNVISFGSWIAVLLGIVITSFFIPNMLRKGTVDLLLSKPISRPTLIIYKYLGGLTFIFLTTAYAVLGVWFAIGVRSGLWPNGTLLLIFTITFFFAILYSVSTFVAVVTRSVVASILLSIAAWFVFFVIGFTYAKIDAIEREREQRDKMAAELKQPPREADPEWVKWLFLGVRSVHAIAPRTEDLNQLNDLVVYTDFLSGNLADMGKFDTSKRNWVESICVSLVWIGVFLGLASLWFSFKDY